MTFRAPSWLGHILLPLLAAGSSVALAQDDPAAGEAPWVQVELLLFRSTDTATAGDETWPAPRDLAWPEPVQVLLEPASPAHAAALAAREFEAALASEERSVVQKTEPGELPFVLLPESQTMLAGPTARIAGSAAQRVLGHIAWRQPLPEPGRPVRVVLTAGEVTGAHHEVEGYLSLTRSRYLHADLRLWLNDFSQAGGGDGALLPEVPVPVPPIPAAASPGIESDPTPAPEQTTAPDAIMTTGVLAPAPVRSARTVVLSTSRGLAPGEVHYLDHPLFGALITVRPWDPAAADALPGDAGKAAAPPEGAQETPPP